ncbi:TetR/AcrR family transcriptional regulator [Allobranchiibius sp. CTAmp26]|uniref:TetR/AcrR family transcriptional regulator n=1 Tax=Allobranchiibius sp. CTAmp26 TaxID=2815214 RepID=UPI001AA0D2C2|nr:TetR/AcrR family transcriptional regulator [Allobranchiibius sp. CTAmp26]MBO1755469.1 TetR/AcrR family transcriptional regulator [Allobranchiibius sp. CTAmp26]
MATAPDNTPDARVVRTRNDILAAALKVLADEGQEALTHPHLARVAGYSRATVYKHWPTRGDLLREAFHWLNDMPHHTPTGDLREDLIAELTMFRTVMRVYRVDRLLAVLADLAVSSKEMAQIRDEMVDDGEAVIRSMLATVAHGPALEAASLMLPGFVLNAAMLHDGPPDDDLIAAAVDITLAGIRAKD